jgi:hypothetical protein
MLVMLALCTHTRCTHTATTTPKPCSIEQINVQHVVFKPTYDIGALIVPSFRLIALVNMLAYTQASLEIRNGAHSISTLLFLQIE